MEFCYWSINYMFGREEGYIIGCIENPHYNRTYSLPLICPHCGKKIVLK